MTFAKAIAVVKLSLMCIHCASDDDAGPNFPGSIEDEFSLLFNGVDAPGTAGNVSSTFGDPVEKFTISTWFKAVGTPAAAYSEGKPKNVRFDIPGYESADSVRSLWRMGDENFSEEGNVSDLVSQNHFTIVGGGSFERETP